MQVISSYMVGLETFMAAKGFTLSLPRGAAFLSAARTADEWGVWVHFNVYRTMKPGEAPERIVHRKLQAFASGESVPGEATFLSAIGGRGDMLALNAFLFDLGEVT